MDGQGKDFNKRIKNMNLLNLLQNILSVLSSAMLYPVMVLLVILFVWMIITIGGFVSEYFLQSKEQKMVKSLDKLRLMIRVGPTLGLMGTIIPMGPALSALSQGDLEKLSSNIIIAFTTTVVGLAIGIAAYYLSTVKNRWINDDIKNLEYFTECIMKNEIP